ncbi:MAG: bis(5'-nucleosyl)-tetraphosphatase (symmetrical) YqeK [Clostridia bacterium]
MEIEEEVKARLSARRYGHTMRVAHTAQELARRYGVNEHDAYTAGLLHDVTRELSREEQLKLCEKHGIILDNVSKETPALMHAITGAFVAKHEFHASDEICSAVRYHTVGRAEMTRLERVIWLSDMIEPAREFRGVDKLRTLANEDLDCAVLEGLNLTFMHLIPKMQRVHVSMLEARNWLLSLVGDKMKGM